jgi:hypothetical protein
MNNLASKQCVPCRGGVPPLKGAELHLGGHPNPAINRHRKTRH